VRTCVSSVNITCTPDSSAARSLDQQLFSTPITISFAARPPASLPPSPPALRRRPRKSLLLLLFRLSRESVSESVKGGGKKLPRWIWPPKGVIQLALPTHTAATTVQQANRHQAGRQAGRQQLPHSRTPTNHPVRSSTLFPNLFVRSTTKQVCMDFLEEEKSWRAAAGPPGERDGVKREKEGEQSWRKREDKHDGLR
jgi:hypothetical protein